MRLSFSEAIFWRGEEGAGSTHLVLLEPSFLLCVGLAFLLGAACDVSLLLGLTGQGLILLFLLRRLTRRLLRFLCVGVGLELGVLVIRAGAGSFDFPAVLLGLGFGISPGLGLGRELGLALAFGLLPASTVRRRFRLPLPTRR